MFFGWRRDVLIGLFLVSQFVCVGGRCGLRVRFGVCVGVRVRVRVRVRVLGVSLIVHIVKASRM